jgi:hypothetical protein
MVGGGRRRRKRVRDVESERKIKNDETAYYRERRGRQVSGKPCLGKIPLPGISTRFHHSVRKRQWISWDPLKKIPYNAKDEV